MLKQHPQHFWALPPAIPKLVVPLHVEPLLTKVRVLYYLSRLCLLTVLPLSVDTPEVIGFNSTAILLEACFIIGVVSRFSMLLGYAYRLGWAV